MGMTQEQFVERLCLFTKASLVWCAHESEQATDRVSSTIELLLSNTSRVSSISQESLQALQGLRQALKQHMEDSKKAPFKQLITSLELLASEHEEAFAVIKPIIESLQFQDRMRQNFENMVKILPIWLAVRQQSAKGLSEEQLREFGQSLLKSTTMVTEREIIRKHIPGLEAEAAAAPVLFF